ncbi:hypothetical protein PI124_g10257 [Phytophthora idaei]|nr:hypothetical protein PI125_g17706 [Phytophthora idaei]KAG3139491.1 hypothetical protein PI126_g16436 [Phytophthora idaei]KAG3244982.1 hypothetical protein PI124_g10257 [Phytophthora idaei]
MTNQIHGILRKRGLLEAEDRASSIAPPPTPVARAQAGISTRDTSVGTPDRSKRDYAPAYRKQPWFVLLALQETQAVDEDAAMASDVLLQRMLDTGYEGNSAKSRACLASLSGTHEVVKRSNLGFYYLTQKGRRSAELCPGSLTGAATTTTTTDSVTTAAASSAASSGSVRKNQTRVVRQRPSSPNWTYAELEDSDEEILTDLDTRRAPAPGPKFPSNPRAAKPATSHLLPSNRFDTNDFAQIFCLPPQTFAPFNSQFRKKNQFTVREIYQRMLLQGPGLNAAKTVGLSTRYKNFYELESALRKRGRDREVEDVRCGKSQRRLGAKTSESLTRLLTAHEYIEE